jgi:hypothetical protein
VYEKALGRWLTHTHTHTHTHTSCCYCYVPIISGFPGFPQRGVSTSAGRFASVASATRPGVCWACCLWPERRPGVFDGVVQELGCTLGGLICCLVSFFCSSARPAGAKKGLSARLYSYAIFHRITGARLCWARGKWLGGDFVLLTKLAGVNQTQK